MEKKKKKTQAQDWTELWLQGQNNMEDLKLAIPGSPKDHKEDQGVLRKMLAQDHILVKGTLNARILNWVPQLSLWAS